MTMYLAVLILVCITQCGGVFTSSYAISTCDQLPKLPILSIEEFLNDGPFTYDFSSSLFFCTNQMITIPPRGTSGLSGVTAFIRGTKATVLEFTVKNKVAIHTTDCNTGEKRIFYFAAAQANSNGAFYCAYTCNGEAIHDYSCASNNKTEFLPQQLSAIEVARSVPNGDKIRPAQDNCHQSNCRSF